VYHYCNIWDFQGEDSTPTLEADNEFPQISPIKVKISFQVSLKRNVPEIVSLRLGTAENSQGTTSQGLKECFVTFFTLFEEQFIPRYTVFIFVRSALTVV
jgi:hypothetical protein